MRTLRAIRELMLRGTPAAIACALPLGCGARTVTLTGLEEEPTATTPALPPALPQAPAGTRLDKVVARAQGWCGLQSGNADLLCGANGQIVEQRPGPYLDLDLSDALDWSYRCALRADGELECDGAALPPPSGPFASVSVGLYGGCARGVDHSTCWSMLGLPSTIVPDSATGALSIQAGNVCWGEEFRFECRGAAGEQWLPAAGYYFGAVATRDGACAAIFPAPDSVALQVDPATDALLHTAQLACFSATGVQSKALGSFSLFDVDADGQGCAVEHSGKPVCWGRFAAALPAQVHSSYAQISVSDSQVCWLAHEGSIECVLL